MTNMVLLDYNGSMKRVTISDLKARLSSHLRLVRAGEEVLVCDRKRPVARILPVRLEEESGHEQKLIARGLLSLPLRKGPASWPDPPGNVSDEAMQQVWQHEREGR